VGSLLAQDVSDHGNYVINYHRRLINDHFSGTYYPSWRTPNSLNYKKTAPFMPRWILDHPLNFKDHPILNKHIKNPT